MEHKCKEYRNNTEKALKYFSKMLAYTVSPYDLKETMEKTGARLVDVRKREDFEKGHIPGSISIPYEEIDSKLDSLDRDVPTIVSCYNATCLLGAKAAVKFAEHNFPVMALLGGYKTWTEDLHYAVTQEE